MGRVISYSEKTGYNDGDYLLLDNGEGGTKRIRADRVGIQLDSTLTDPNKAAPANAVKPVDAAPTQGSSNVVSSGGVYSALHNTDTTLSQSGQAADAKATGDKIDGLNSALESAFYISRQYVDISKAIYDKRYGAINVSLYDNTGYYVIPGINLKAGTYYYKDIFAEFSHYIYTGEETLNTFSGSGRISGSITFEADVVIYLTSNISYGNVIFADDVLPQSYIYGVYYISLKDGLVDVDDTLSRSGVCADAGSVGALLGVNGFQYLKESDFVPNTRYGTANVTAVSADGYFTIPSIALKAGTYYFRNIYTDFSHVVNKSTGVRTSLSSLVGAGRVSGSVTIEYDFYLYITANATYDTLSYGKVVWSNYPYYSMGNNRVYGLFANRPDSNRYSENVQPVFTVEKDGKGDFATIKEALETAVLYPNSIVKVGQGIFDLIEEFGADYFANLGAVGNSGLELYNDITVEFTSNTLVTCHYTGDNSNVMRYFSPFNLKKSEGYFGGFTIKNLHLECSNVRYGIHDESNASNLPYKNKYFNCNIKVDNRNNTAFSARQCIGGGLGSASEIIIRDCVFESVVDSGTGGTGIVSYHNGGNGRSDIIIKDCYFKGNDTVKASWHGTSTKISTMTMSGCSVGSAPYCVSEASGDTIENMELIAWNNEIRT